MACSAMGDPVRLHPIPIVDGAVAVLLTMVEVHPLSRFEQPVAQASR
jgi:hypothetical protein